MLGAEDLVVTGSSLGHPPFLELVRAAAAGGFRGLSLWPQESYQRARESGLSVAELRTMLDDHAVVVNDVDALVCWLGEDAPADMGAGGSREAMLCSAGEALDACYLNVVMMSPGPLSADAAAEVFAGVVDRAAEHGLTAHLEFVPFMAVPDAACALDIVERSGRPAAGVMIDSWHCFRGATRDEDLSAIPAERVLGVQLNDAPKTPMNNPMVETLHHRLTPGEGDIDLVGLIRLLDRIGSRAPITVEVFSDALVERYGAPELAIHLGDAMRRVRAEARSG